MDSETLKTILTIILTVGGGLVTFLVTNAKTRGTAIKTQADTAKTIEDALAFTQSQFTKVQERADETDRELTQSNARAIELLERNGVLSDKLEVTELDLKGAKAEIQKLIDMNIEGVKKRAEMEVELAKLRDKTNKFDSMQEEIDDLRSQIADLNRQLQAADVERHSLTSSYDRDREKFQHRERELTDQNKRLQEQVKALGTRLETETKHSAKQDARLEEQAGQIESLQVENRQLKTELDNLRSAPSQLPPGTLMYTEERGADGSTVIHAEVTEPNPLIPTAGETTTDQLNTQEKSS